MLLKNERGLLPLAPSVRRIAVLGPSADDPVAVLGNYNGISSKQVTPLEGIERQFSTADVHYALGATYTGATPALVPSTVLAPPDGGRHGVRAEYFDNPDLQGEPKLRRTESRAYFEMEMEPADVIAAVGKEHYSIRWTATLTPAFAGEYQLTVRTNRWNRTGKARLFLDDVELEFGGGPSTQATSTTSGPRLDGRLWRRCAWRLGAPIACASSSGRSGAGGLIQLAWIPPAEGALAEAERSQRMRTSLSSASA